MGKALIVTRTRAHQDGDIVREGETGLLVPPGDVVALRQAIIRLHRDPAEAQRMGANARRVVEEGLNYDVYLRRMLQIANEVGAEMAACRRAGQSNGSRPARVASGDAADEWRVRTGSR